MRVIGLTGGIASGKSTLAAELAAGGVPVVDADALARQVVAPGSPALREIAAAFGAEVIRADGALDRARLAGRVFRDPEARRRLEAITHPAVRAATTAELRLLAAAGHPLALYDVPLLYEVGLETTLDAVIVAWVPRAVQLDRLRARDGLALDEAEARLAAQLPLDEKAARADVVVDNSGPREALPGKAALLLAALRAGLGRRLPNAPPVRY